VNSPRRKSECIRIRILILGGSHWNSGARAGWWSIPEFIQSVGPVKRRSITDSANRSGTTFVDNLAADAKKAGEDPAAYVETLDVDRAARQSLFDRVTVQETAFFRHPGQFEALAQHVLPGLASPVTICRERIICCIPCFHARTGRQGPRLRCT